MAFFPSLQTRDRVVVSNSIGLLGVLGCRTAAVRHAQHALCLVWDSVVPASPCQTRQASKRGLFPSGFVRLRVPNHVGLSHF